MKKWLIDRYLPIWAKETVLSDNQALRKENAKLKQQIREQEAYIQGVHNGLRAGKKISIYNGGGAQ